MMPLPHDVDIGWPSDPKLFRYGCMMRQSVRVCLEKLLREDFWRCIGD